MDIVQKLKHKIADLYLLNHPFYKDWDEGKLSKKRLALYAEQYYKHVEAFPRYISSTHSLCQDHENRRILLENLNDEEGKNGKPHPELWLDFAEGTGLRRDQVRHAKNSKAITNLISTFFKFSRSSYPEGLAALYAYEYQIPEVAETTIRGLKRHYGINDKKTLSFFEVHKTADIVHRKACEELLHKLKKKEQRAALNAAHCAGTALWDFLTEMHQTEIDFAV